MRPSWGGHCAQAWEFIGPLASHSEVPSDSSRYVLDIDTPCYMFMDISTLRKGKGEGDVIPLSLGWTATLKHPQHSLSTVSEFVCSIDGLVMMPLWFRRLDICSSK